MSADVVLSELEAEQLADALWNARRDIWQTARVTEYNLSGRDPTFPEDSPVEPPRIPKQIHRAGLDESYRVHAEVCEAIRVLALKRLRHPMETTDQSREPEQQAKPTLSETMAKFKRPGSAQLWSFHGNRYSTVLREVHDVGCDCSYCRTFAAKGRAGIELPECKARNSWRILWWRWRGRLHVLRWTLPPKREGLA